jgi:hypothetical protein
LSNIDVEDTLVVTMTEFIKDVIKDIRNLILSLHFKRNSDEETLFP